MKTSFIATNNDMCVYLLQLFYTHTHTYIVPEYCLETYDTIKDMILLEKFLSTLF